MAINPLQKRIMVRMNEPNLKTPVQFSHFPSEPSYRIDEAIEQLYQMGYITAVQSKADSHWVANLITPKGYALLDEAGLI